MGDQVLVRNYNKKSKFEPIFLPERFVVADIMANGRIILVQSTRTDRFLRRHPNDLKHFEGNIPEPTNDRTFSEQDILQAWREAFASIDDSFEHGMDDEDSGDEYEQVPLVRPPRERRPNTIVRPQRERRPNTRYFNDNLVR